MKKPWIMVCALCVIALASCQSAVVNQPLLSSTPTATAVPVTPEPTATTVPTATPVPTGGVIKTQYTFTPDMLIGERSPYELDVPEGWGRESAVRNQRIYYLSNPYTLNMIDEQGKTMSFTRTPKNLIHIRRQFTLSM